jgi:transcriptional regulator with XRE-family HTH domain
MISLNVKGESVNTLKESYEKTADHWIGKCAICQRLYQHYGTYSRVTPYHLGPFSIRRVYCPDCKKSHALLPCFIIAYSRVLDVVREAAIAGICFEQHTIEELAELLDVDASTVARWWRIFRQKAGTLMMALAKKLADSPGLSDWVSGSFETDSQITKKILELIGRCRSTYSPDFLFCGFAWVNLFDPYLLAVRN